MAFVQQPRQPTDGAISVFRLPGDKVSIGVVDDGREFAIPMSEHNAARVLGALALLLGVRLNAQDAKGIRY